MGIQASISEPDEKRVNSRALAQELTRRVVLLVTLDPSTSLLTLRLRSGFQYRSSRAAMSSEASVRADVLQELIDGYIVAPETLEWPMPIT